MADSRTQFIRSLTVFFSGLFLFVLILILPAPAGMAPEARQMVAVVVLMGTWWIGEAVPIPVTALLPLVLYPLLGIMSSKEVAPNYTNHLVFLFLGGFMIALAMEKWNFHKRLALNIIIRIGTNPKRIVLGFMVATAFLSMWISNTAATMMMLPVAMAVVRQIASQASLEGKQDTETEAVILRNLGLVLMLGLAYSASIGGVGTLIGTPPNIIFAGFYKNLFPDREEITFFQWMVLAVPVVLIFLPIVWGFLCRFITSFPLSKIQFASGGEAVIRKELDSLGLMNRAERYITCVFFAAAFLWIFRKPIALGFITLPGWSQLFTHPQFLHDATVAVAMGLLLMILPLGFREGVLLHGSPRYFVLDWKTVENGVPWGILLLFGGGFALAAGFTKSGLDLWIGKQLSAIGVLPLALVVLMVCLGITFLTEMTSNTATTTMILPVLAAAAVAAKIDPLYIMVPATLSASFAFMLPVATPPNAIVFGSGWVTIPQMSKAGLALNFTGAILVTSLVLLLVQVILLQP